MKFRIHFILAFLSILASPAVAATATFSWDAKLGANFHLSPSTLFQLNTYYRSARINPQGKSNPTFYVNTGLRQEVLQNRASVILTVSDVFNTLNRENIIDTPELYQKESRKRNSQIIYVGFTYRFGKSAKKQAEIFYFQ